MIIDHFVTYGYMRKNPHQTLTHSYFPLFSQTDQSSSVYNPYPSTHPMRKHAPFYYHLSYVH